MSVQASVESDERTVAIENFSYRCGYFLLYCGVLYAALYRAVVRHEAAFDLVALAIVSGAISVLYQARHKALTHGRAKKMLLIALFFGVLGAIGGAVMAWYRS